MPRKKQVMRLPNGYGTIAKLSGNRRNPFVAKVNPKLHISEDGKASYKYEILGYYPDRASAMDAIADYRKNPYDISEKVTFQELYEKWSEDKFCHISVSNINKYKSVYKLCSTLYNMPFRDIRLIHLQSIVDTSGKKYSTMNTFKILLNQLYEYAIKYEICQKNYSTYLDISAVPVTRNEHTAFTAGEVALFWSHADENLYYSIPIMLIYSGLRINELLCLKKEHVHIKERFIDVIASKTNAGVRKVPIAEFTVCYWMAWLDSAYDYVFYAKDGSPLTYSNYRGRYWNPYMQKLGLDGHKVHDTRHTFTTLLKKYNINEYARKKIVGHAIDDVTDGVYTHMDIEWIRNEFSKLKK